MLKNVFFACMNNFSRHALRNKDHIYNARVLRACQIKNYTTLNQPTIYALSSGHGKCGVAVIRVSGPDTASALKSLTGLNSLPKPRYALLRNLRHPKSGEVLDQGLILWFPGPKSFTGEDCCEFQVHGGLAVVSAILNALGTIPNLRLARPGEFTRRAFYNGKLDLTEVEGLADLLNAETEAQRKQAFLQAQGFLSKIYNRWAIELTKCVAHVEAHIDFDETEALEADILREVADKINVLRQEVAQHLIDGRKGERLRSGVRTVILGETNVGKSSLMNALCRRPASIVTPLEGTTRDILEVTLDIEGYPIILTDTAGLRYETDDIIEREGINRALQSYEAADLVILMVDSLKYLEWLQMHPNKNYKNFLESAVHKLRLESILNQSKFDNDLFTKQCLVVFNKSDLIEARHKQLFNNNSDTLKNLFISCKTEEGFSDLISTLAERLKHLCGEPSEHASMNQARHKQHLTDCLSKLDLYVKSVSDAFGQSGDTALLAEHLRVALRHLGKLTGSVTTEQLLDVIFKDFCIGK